MVCDKVRKRLRARVRPQLPEAIIADDAGARPSLPPATQLENYWIQRLLATGGFSRVYLAHDENDVPVAIKEYRDVAERRPAGKFLHGMRCFFEEGRALTALLAPQRGAGAELLPRQRHRVPRDALRARPHAARAPGSSTAARSDETWIRQTFAQLLNGLREVHTNKLLHLDIKPANIYLRNDGSPLCSTSAPRARRSGEGLEAAADLHARLSPRPSSTCGATCSGPGATSIRSARRCTAALSGGEPPIPPTPRRPRRLRAGAQDLGREVFGRAARHRRLVPAAGSSRAAAERARRCRRRCAAEREPERRAEEPVLEQLRGAMMRLKGSFF
jgi:hypothetical protein